MMAMGIESRWMVECDANGCSATLGPFDIESDARESVRYGDDGWQVTYRRGAFGDEMYTYCPKHNRDIEAQMQLTENDGYGER